MVAESPPDGLRWEARASAGRLFGWVFLATLAADLALSLLPAGVPFLGGPARWAVGLVAGFVGMRRSGRLARTVAATCGGIVLATLLTGAAYVLTGQAAADLFGPAATLMFLLAGVVIGTLAPTAGALAWVAAGRVRARRA